MISISECKRGRVYKLRSRNLSFGVFDGNTGFIGIREKFGSRYLDTEYHWDTGPPFGTARPEEDIGINIPEDICLISREEILSEYSTIILIENKRLFGFLEKIEESTTAP